MIIGNNVMIFIKRNDAPQGKQVAYTNMVCDYRSLKEEKYRTQLMIGGDVLEYAEKSSSPAASLLETKIIINSVISDTHKGARFMTSDLKDYFSVI